MVMISLSTSPGCGPRFLAGWASSLSSRASQCGRNAWQKSSNWQKSSTSRSNIDASPHLMAPTQKEEFKGDKGLASPQTRNSGYISQHSFCLCACGPVGNAAASHRETAAHRLAGFVIEYLTRRPVTQRLVRPLLVVKAQPAADPPARLDHRAIGFDEGEWRGALRPRALSEPDVNLSIHPAPIIQPLVPKSSGRTGWDCAAEASVASPRPPTCALGTVCICETPIAR